MIWRSKLSTRHSLIFSLLFLYSSYMTHISILCGGISSEREVSLRSGANMQEWCKNAWYTTNLYNFPSDLPRFLSEYAKTDFVIPVFHGIYGEDGQTSAFLETLSIPYAYSSPRVHALCIDKNLTNLALSQLGIHIPESYFVSEWSSFEESTLPYPLIVKPNRWWSSISTHKVGDRESMIEAIKSITDDDILVQQCIEWREFTVWVYRDNSWYHTLPIIEIRTLSWDFFDYSEKYETDGSNEVFMTSEDELQKRLSSLSLRICEYIGTKWVVRIDWRYDGRDIYFLEVNTIPGFTEASLVPKMWKKAGKTEKEFIEMMVK